MPKSKVADKVVAEMEVGTSKKLTLINKAGKISKGSGSLPTDEIADFRAIRRDEQSAFTVLKTYEGNGYDDRGTYVFTIPVTVPFIPFDWEYGTYRPKDQVEQGYLRLKFFGRAYKGNSVRFRHLTVGLVKQFGTHHTDATFDDLSFDEISEQSPQAFRIAEKSDDIKPVFFRRGSPLSKIIKELNGCILTHNGTAKPTIEAGAGLDVFAQELSAGNKSGIRSFVSLGFGLGVEKRLRNASIELMIGPNTVKMPVDHGVYLSVFHSPELLDVPSKDRSADWIVEIAGLPAQGFVEYWNLRVAEPHYSALTTVDGARDLSFLPYLKVSKENSEPRFSLAWRIRQHDTRSQGFDAFGPAEFIGAFPSHPAVTFEARATFPEIRGRDRRQVARDVSVTVNSPTLTTGLYDDLKGRRQFEIKLAGSQERISRGTAANDTIVRVGALDVSFGAAGSIDATISVSFENFGDRSPEKRTSLLRGRVPHVSVQFRRFGLTNVAPGGEDPTPDELLARDTLRSDERRALLQEHDVTPEIRNIVDDVTRAAPVVAVKNVLVPRSGELVLQAEEITDVDRSRNLVLRIRKSGTQLAKRERRVVAETGDQDKVRAVIIDIEPFQIAKVTLPHLLDDVAFGDDMDGEFAVYRISEREGAGWSLARIADGFDLYLPPQGIGEAMEKGKPWPNIAESERTGEKLTIDYRLSPTARFWLRDQDVMRRYSEAPWNLRRRFGDAGQRAPGTEFAGLRAELLYGLAMHLRGDSLRLAELGARIGALRPNLPANELGPGATLPAKTRDDIYNNLRQRWANVGKIYGTRLAMLEPWRLGTQGTFLAEEGVSYLLRVPKLRQQGGVPADMGHPLDLDATGLPGGATWGLESNNIYQETIANPRSTGGRVAKLAFTVLGGSGSFTAEFAQGKTRIAAEASIGRTHRYVIERLGRIGLIWNHAKHVTVYERSVLPSHQFSDPEVWPRLQGRPVLRKVEEYVELLQPIRPFGELDAPPVRRGMVEASIFKTVKIPVDGRNWGRDIPEGWVVPLWRPDADQTIYPKPQAAIRLVATGESAEPTLDAEATQPQRMMFFTSTRGEDKADTDRWAPVQGVDFVNIVRPKPLPASAVPTDIRQPDDLIEDPLYAAVTIPINTAGRQVSLGAGRVLDSPGAALETLTFMRAAPALVVDTSQAAQAKSLDTVAEVRRLLADGQRLLESIPGRLEALARETILISADWKSKLVSAIRNEANDLRQRVSDTAKTAGDAIKILPPDGSWISSGTAAASTEVQQLKRRTKVILDEIRTAVNEAEKNTNASIDAVTGDWTRARLTIQHEAGSLFLAAHALIRSPWPLLSETRDLYREFDKFVFNVEVPIGEERNRIAGLVEKLVLPNDQLAEAKRLARELTFKLEARVGNLINQLASATERLPPRIKIDAVGIEQKVRDLRAAVDQTAKTTREEIAAFDDVTKIRPRLKEFVSRLDTPLTEIRTTILVPARDVFAAALEKAKAEVDKISDIINILDSWLSNVKKLIETLLEDIGKATRPSDAKKDVSEAARRIRDTLTSVDKGVTIAADAIITNFADVAGRVLGKVGSSIAATIVELNALIASFEAGGLAGINAAETWALSLVDQLSDSVGNPLEEAVQAIGDRAGAFARQALGISKDVERSIGEGIGRLASVPTFQNPESTLNLIRAAGQSPLVPNFKFNRDRIAYVFDDFAEAVRTSPMAGLVNRVGDDLKALGLRIPTDRIAERILPAELQNFDISKVFPDLAGFKLDGLFSGIRLPRIAQDTVKVTHGFDRASQTAWAKASSDIPLGPPSDILSFGPLRLTILGGRFTALADIVASVQGPPRTKANAEIVGDWQLAFGGLNLVTFERTRIAYDDVSGLNIDIAPDRIRFDRAVQFLSDLIKTLGDPNSGFILELEVDPNNRPIGVRAGLDLPLPPVAAGAFAASGIRLAASTALTVSDRNIRGTIRKGFAVETAAAIGRPDEPFTLMVAFLNGGGYLTARALYLPEFNYLEARVGIGIVAGVGADFAFGPARGSVYVQFGAEGAFVTPGSGISLEVFLLVRGGVNVLNLITIGLVMRLGITYQGGSVDARGYLRVEIKISIFFTLRVQVNVHYHLAGRSQSSFRRVLADDTVPRYLDLFA